MNTPASATTAVITIVLLLLLGDRQVDYAAPTANETVRVFRYDWQAIMFRPAAVVESLATVRDVATESMIDDLLRSEMDEFNVDVPQ